MTRWLTVALLIAAGCGASQAQEAQTADLANGERSFRKCIACHDIGPTAKNKVGPILNGLDGRKTGTIEGYSYSNANKNSGIVWGAESFAQYIRAPLQAIPGTKMAFIGITNEKERGDLWAYLKQFAADGSKK